MKTTAGTESPLVLVVDDHADTREMCAEFLEAMGFRVETAASGGEALAKAPLGADVILMDLSLPDVDGVEVTRRLKSDARTAGIPVIALTGHGAGEFGDHARDAGCASFLVKPCPPDAMVQEIRKVLDRTKRGSR